LVLIIVSVGLISLYFIPRQEIVLPSAEERIRTKSNSDWQSRNTIGTAMNRGRFLSAIVAA